eukprot:gene3881-7750_t
MGQQQLQRSLSKDHDASSLSRDCGIKIADIEDIEISEIFRQINSTLNHQVAITSSFIKAKEIWSSQPTVIMVTRRLGCALCRNYARVLSSNIMEYSKKTHRNVILMGITHELETLSADDFFHYFKTGRLFLDSNQSFYNVLGGRKLNYWKVFTFQSIKAIITALFACIRGDNRGEGHLLGGTLVVSRSKVWLCYKEKYFGDRPLMDDVLHAIDLAYASEDKTTMS